MKEQNLFTIVIDIGTSSTRVILVNREGEIKQIWQSVYGLCVIDERTVLQDPEEIMEYIWEMLASAAGWMEKNQGKVECISVTGQRSSVIPMSKEGQALTNAISWQDTRAYNICLGYKKYWKEIYSITGMKLCAVFSAPKMIMLKHLMPEMYKKSYKLVGFQEYVLWHLTHQFVTDHTIASRTSLFDVKELEWSLRLLDFFQIDKTKLCRLIPAGGLAGDAIPRVKQLFQIESDLPVISAGGDQQCAALGLGCVKQGDIEVNSGTGAYAIAISDRPVFDEKMRVNCNVSAIPGKWIIEGTVMNAGKAVDWLNSEIFGGTPGDLKEFVKACEETSVGSNGVIAVTSFSGKGTPEWNSKVRASFLNIGFNNKKADFARALLEGIASDLNDCLQTVEELSERKSNAVYAAGGMIKNETYCQILSDMFGKKLYKPEICEATGMGAWISAQVYLKNVETYDEAYKKYAKKEKENCYVPNLENTQRYREDNSIRKYYIKFFDEIR